MAFEYILAIMPALLRGVTETLRIFSLTLIFSLPLGLLVAFGVISRYWPFRIIGNLYVFLLRGTPLLLQLFFVYYALPMFTPVKLDRLPAAIVTFIFNYAAYFAEIYRAGIQSIDKGQYEAARSLGYTGFQTMRLIIIPQTLRRIIPPVSNEVITLVKDTALVSAIAVPELLKAARDAANRDVNAVSFVVAAVVYLVLTSVLTLLSRYLEHRVSRHEQEVSE